MMLGSGYVVLSDGSGELTGAGKRFLTGLGVDLERARGAKRHYCRSCIDWTERRHHISGAVGAVLAQTFLERRWVARIQDSRALTVTAGGRKKLSELGLEEYRAAPASRSFAAGGSGIGVRSCNPTLTAGLRRGERSSAEAGCWIARPDPHALRQALRTLTE